MVVNDVIACFPGSIRNNLVEYARSAGIDLLERLQRLHRLEEERQMMSDALEERLAAINELTAAAEERNALIDEQRLQLDDLLAAQPLEPEEPEPEGPESIRNSLVEHARSAGIDLLERLHRLEEERQMMSDALEEHAVPSFRNRSGRSCPHSQPKTARMRKPRCAPPLAPGSRYASPAPRSTRPP